jgi:hypothetical protein
MNPPTSHPELLDLMQRITIYTKDGKHYTKQSTGREFMWDFDEEARRIRDVIPGLAILAAHFESIIATCRDLDRQDRVDELMQLTRPSGKLGRPGPARLLARSDP